MRYDTRTRRRGLIALATVVAGAAVLTAALAQSSTATQTAKIRKGGTFRIKLGGSIDPIDPALVAHPGTAHLLDPVCARLMNYPDKPAPEGLRVVPEVAASHPRISNRGRTYTFTLRRGFRFSDGRPVRASAFAHAINRALHPSMNAPGANFVREVAGASDVLAGRRRAVAGVAARGYRLVVRLTRPVPDFPARMTLPSFCAVPPTLPIDPEGVTRFPSAGPYYIAEYVRGERLVLRRNRFYGGKRPQHVDRFFVDLERMSPIEVIERVERGQADFGGVPPRIHFEPRLRLIAKYGVNRSRFFVRPGLEVTGLLFNTSRPLFRNNTRLRRAVNFAIDRRTALPGTYNRVHTRLTDQYLPPGIPAFRDAKIYPLRGPDLRRARALARGRTRSGKAVLYTAGTPAAVAAGQSVKQSLRQIGIDVEPRAVPPGELLRGGWDMTTFVWRPPYVDPYAYINLLFEGRFIRSGENLGRFNSPRYNRQMTRAARLHGAARYRAYAQLDVQLARDAAPMVAVSYPTEPTLVGRRVDPRCIILRPALDLTAVCLKR